MKKKREFPLVIRNGSVSVKIYKTPSHGCDSFTLAYWQDGERKRQAFSDLEKAKIEAQTVTSKLGSADGDVLLLKSADRAAYLRAKELSDEIGVPIEVCVARYVSMKKALGDTPPETVIADYRKRNPTSIKPKLIKDVVNEMINAKKADGLNDGYRRHLRYDLNKFMKKFNGNIGAVAGTEVDAWLRELGLAPRTRKNLRTSVQTLFNFAKARRYLPKDHDEMEAVTVVKDKGGEIEIFTPEELNDLLTFARAHEVPFMALGAFAGIRHAEIMRLAWEDVKFDANIIEIRAGKAKTASRRVIPLLDNLRAWLLPYQTKGPICTFKNMADELADLVKLANTGLAERKIKRTVAWKHNGLRHSFISYRVADTQNVNQVALEAGNSSQMIFKHYRELVRPEEAKKWFAITPESVKAAAEEREGLPANVVALPIAGTTLGQERMNVAGRSTKA